MRKLLPFTILFAAALSGCTGQTALTTGQAPPRAVLLAKGAPAAEHATSNAERAV